MDPEAIVWRSADLPTTEQSRDFGWDTLISCRGICTPNTFWSLVELGHHHFAITFATSQCTISRRLNWPYLLDSLGSQEANPRETMAKDHDSCVGRQVLAWSWSMLGLIPNGTIVESVQQPLSCSATQTGEPHFHRRRGAQIARQFPGHVAFPKWMIGQCFFDIAFCTPSNKSFSLFCRPLSSVVAGFWDVGSL